MAISSYNIYYFFIKILSFKISIVLSLIVAVIIYVIFVLFFKIFSYEELLILPGGNFIAKCSKPLIYRTKTRKDN